MGDGEKPRSASVELPVRRAIVLLLAIDVAFAVAYLVNFAAGQPFSRLTALLNLNGEANLPTWYASVKYFVVASLLGLFAHHHFERSGIRTWPLAALALAFLAFSVDEAATIHEWLGEQSNALLSGGARENTLFKTTGIWMFIIGLPAAVATVFLIWSVRIYLSPAPGSVVKFLGGFIILIVGAIGVEIISNFVVPGTGAYVIQIFFEELLELVGVTVILWGVLDLLQAYRFYVRFYDAGSVSSTGDVGEPSRGPWSDGRGPGSAAPPSAARRCTRSRTCAGRPDPFRTSPPPKRASSADELRHHEAR